MDKCGKVSRAKLSWFLGISVKASSANLFMSTVCENIGKQK